MWSSGNMCQGRVKIFDPSFACSTREPGNYLRKSSTSVSLIGPCPFPTNITAIPISRTVPTVYKASVEKVSTNSVSLRVYECVPRTGALLSTCPRTEGPPANANGVPDPPVFNINTLHASDRHGIFYLPTLHGNNLIVPKIVVGSKWNCSDLNIITDSNYAFLHINAKLCSTVTMKQKRIFCVL